MIQTGCSKSDRRQDIETDRHNLESKKRKQYQPAFGALTTEWLPLCACESLYGVRQLLERKQASGEVSEWVGKIAIGSGVLTCEHK